MSSIGRSPPPVLVPATRSAHGVDAPHAGQQQAAAAGPHHGVHPLHHVHPAGESHVAHVHATPHAPRPRKPPKPRKGRRKNGSGEPGEEEELDIDDESNGCGTTPVGMDGGQHDGGDNHDQGESGNKREDRLQRAHFEEDDAPALSRDKRAPTLRATDTAFATNRYHRGLCEALVGSRPRPEAAARVAELDLELMRATLHVAQVDRGGIGRARANLLAHAPAAPLGALRPLPDSPAGRLNCIAVMKELQLQRRKSMQERQQSRAHLEVRLRARAR